MSECPIIFWAVEGWTPLAASVVAKVCLRLWNVNTARVVVAFALVVGQRIPVWQSWRDAALGAW